MNWEAVQAVAELSAAVGVLLSLGYVAIQIKRNTASVRAGTVARSSEMLSRLRDTLWSDADAAQVYERALSGMEIIEFLSPPFVEFLDSQVKSCLEPPLLMLRSRWEEAAKTRREHDG